MVDVNEMKAAALARCQMAFPDWQGLTTRDFEFDDPKGFSSFTMAIRALDAGLAPPAVLYRHLEGKENAILDFATERSTFLLLGEARVAAHCYQYDDIHRLEAFYQGRTITAQEVFDPEIQRKIANELFRMHQLEPEGLPSRSFFELLHGQWGDMARSVLGEHRSEFPPHEQAMCSDLEQIYEEETLAKVLCCLPDRPPVFCHNDTYHGNIMLLDDGSIKLLDFEFSCLNHIAFDFANLFAETVMEHGFEEPPHFRIAEPRFGDADIARLIGFYLDNVSFDDPAEREAEAGRLLDETRLALLLSDFMYAMAALPLSLEPIQKIRFIPYAHQRLKKFLASWEEEFGSA